MKHFTRSLLIDKVELLCVTNYDAPKRIYSSWVNKKLNKRALKMWRYLKHE